MTPATPPVPDTQRQLTGTKVGIVTSDKRDKTRTVAVDFQEQHRKYGKYLLRQAKFHVHDQANDSKAGDRVEIASCRPLSKTKSWRLVRVIERAPEKVDHQTASPLEAEQTDDPSQPQASA